MVFDKSAYMREYMRNRYKQNTTEGKMRRRSTMAKTKNNISDEEAEKYGIYLYDILKLREMKLRVPLKLLQEIITEQE